MHPKTEEVLKQLEVHRDAIKAHGVRRLGLFGSYARGEPSPRSDLDFVVEFETKSFDAYMDLKDYLEGLLGRRVDLVISDTIKPRLRKTILQEAVHAPGL
jgi:predicted nucleotidyltransferase